jgi:lipopolysaccharide transport system permease protein
MKYLKEVWASRELLVNFTQREIKGKYKRTVFGQLWSLVNPLALMLIYTLVFALILRVHPNPGSPSGLNVFALWLLCGLLPWTFVSNVINIGLGTLVLNANLIQKVYFNRILLPLSVVGSSFYNWIFEMAVLVVALSIAGGFVLPWLPLMIVAMVLIALFAAGIALMLSIANVYFRDTQYFVTLLLQIWMYLSPIIYPESIVQADSARIGGLFGTNISIADLYGLNPMEHFVTLFRNLLYDERWPDASDWFICVGWAIGSLVIGTMVFRHNERKLAELL